MRAMVADRRLEAIAGSPVVSITDPLTHMTAVVAFDATIPTPGGVILGTGTYGTVRIYKVGDIYYVRTNEMPSVPVQTGGETAIIAATVTPEVRVIHHAGTRIETSGTFEPAGSITRSFVSAGMSPVYDRVLSDGEIARVSAYLAASLSLHTHTHTHTHTVGRQASRVLFGLAA